MELTRTDGYRQLLEQISDAYTQGRVRAVQAVNTHMTQTYWKVGWQIVEFEQGGKAKAAYGKALISNLTNDLTPCATARDLAAATSSICPNVRNCPCARRAKKIPPQIHS